MSKIKCNNSLHSNRSKIRLRILIYGFVFLYLFVAILVSSGYAICICDDGPAGLESLGEDLCCVSSTADQANKIESFTVTKVAQNDNCLDLPAVSLFIGVLQSKEDRSVQQTFFLGFLVNITTRATLTISRQNVDYISGPLLNTPLISYRTVSLLI